MNCYVWVWIYEKSNFISRETLKALINPSLLPLSVGKSSYEDQLETFNWNETVYSPFRTRFLFLILKRETLENYFNWSFLKLHDLKKLHSNLVPIAFIAQFVGSFSSFFEVYSSWLFHHGNVHGFFNRISWKIYRLRLQLCSIEELCEWEAHCCILMGDFMCSFRGRKTWPGSSGEPVDNLANERTENLWR